MLSYRKYLILLFSIIILVSCKHHKKPSLAGDEPVEASDFIDFFQPVKLPYQFTEADLDKKDNDSLLISYKVFTQFVPDSILSKEFGKGIKPKIYPMGKVDVPKHEIYLFAKAIYGEKEVGILTCFDRKEKFIAGMEILRPDQNAATKQLSGIDKKFSIYETVQRKNADGTISEGKEVYILNNEAKKLMLILTDELEDHPTEIVNPIDTLSRKNKLSADYTINKMNFVSVRDARRADHINFFIHFEKENGECIGELKGEAKILSPTFAEFRSNSDPCVLQFTFTQNSVKLKEAEGCGSHRGTRCIFDGTFPRSKPPKKASKK